MKLEEHKTHYSNSKLWHHYYTNETGRYEGEFLNYYNGKLYHSCYYKNGKRISKEYYLMNKIKKVININENNNE